MRKERLTFFKIFITVGLLTSLPITIILTNSARNNRDIRSKAALTTPTPGKIIFVPFSFSKDQDDEEMFEFPDRAQIRNGFVPPTQTTDGPQFTATVLDDAGNVLLTRNFSLPRLVAIDGIDTRTRRQKGELKKVAANSQGLILPYHPNATFLQIKNPQGETTVVFSLQNASSTDNIIDLHELKGDAIGKKMLFYKIPLPASKAFAANGTFNIAIIGDNYNGDNLHFQNDVTDVAAGLVSVEPFKTYKSNIIFYSQLSAVPICSFSTTLTCNDTQALQQASGLPYDKVYVLYNGPYGGFAYVAATLAYGTNATNMPVAVKQGLFIHELAGHTLAGLMDEFSYGTTGASYAPNCSDSPSCPSWSSIPGLGCFSTCGYSNLFRATDNSSVMNTALLSGVISFDTFSTQVVTGKLVPYFNPSPPTPTIPPAVPTPTTTATPTLTPIPTATPAVTAAATPAGIHGPAGAGLLASITPTATITPPPADTPTPSPPTRCSFPNFCTRAKFCAVENVLPVACAGPNLICCRGQAPSYGDNITPTITQKFELLPTIPIIPQDHVTNSPTPAIPTTTPTTAPTVSIPPTPVVASPTTPTLTELLSPTSIVGPQGNTAPTIPPPTPPSEENYPFYPTSTPYQVENIVFERPTPTPPTKVSILDILAAPSRFVNNLVKNFFSLFSGK